MFAKFIHLNTELNKPEKNIFLYIYLFFKIHIFIFNLKHKIKKIEHEKYYILIPDLFQFSKIVDIVTKDEISYNANILSIRYYRSDYSDISNMARYDYYSSIIKFKLSIKIPKKIVDSDFITNGQISYTYGKYTYTKDIFIKDYKIFYGDNTISYDILMTMIKCYCDLIKSYLKNKL